MPNPWLKTDWWLARLSHVVIPALIAFALGVASAYLWPQLPWLSDSTGLGVWTMLWLGILCLTTRRALVLAVLWLWIFQVGGAYFAFQLSQIPKTDIRFYAQHQSSWVLGEVLSKSARSGKTLIQVRQLNQTPVTGAVFLKSTQAFLKPIPIGQPVWIQGTLSHPEPASSPGSFDEARYCLGEGVSAVLSQPTQFQLATELKPSLTGQLADGLHLARAHVAEVFLSSLPAEAATVLGGIVLGDKAIPVEKETRTAFINTGLIHTLAASGMNVGIIAGFLYLTAQALRLPWRLRLLVAMVGVAVYAMMTGLPPSIQRAALMLELALALKVFNRQLNALFLLCLAVDALLLIQPNVIASIGFQFSVLSTFGIITMMEPLQAITQKAFPKCPLWLADSFWIPLVAQIWVLPLSVMYFNQWPWLSVPMNMVSLIFIVPLTCLGFVAGVLSFIWSPLGALLAKCAQPFLDFFLTLIHWGASKDWATATMASPSGVTVLLSYGLLLIVTLWLHPVSRAIWILPEQETQWKLNRPLRFATAILCLLTLILGVWSVDKFYQQGATQLSLLPVSLEEPAMVIQPEHSKQALVLLPSYIGYRGLRQVDDFLRQQGIQKIAFVTQQAKSLPVSSLNDSETNAALMNWLKHHHTTLSQPRIQTGTSTALMQLSREDKAQSNLAITKDSNQNWYILTPGGAVCSGEQLNRSCLWQVQLGQNRPYQLYYAHKKLPSQPGKAITLTLQTAVAKTKPDRHSPPKAQWQLRQF